MSKKQKATVFLLGAIIIIQLFQIEKSNPPIVKQKDFVELTNPPADLKTLIKEACYDCHSYETKYPWYTYVAPLNWWIGHHINEGREHLNFSEWGDYPYDRQLHKLEEFYEEVEEGEMPLTSYTLVHANARLSEDNVAKMVAWVKSIPAMDDPSNEDNSLDDDEEYDED